MLGILLGLFLREVAEVLAGYVDDAGGKLVADGDDDAAEAPDALDAADDAGKLALGDLHLLTGTAGEVEVVEEDDLVVGLGSDAHVVAHGLVGDVEYLFVTVVALVEHGVEDEAERLEEFEVALDAHQLVETGVNEDVVEEVGREVHLVHADLDEAHGYVGLVDVGLTVQAFHHGVEAADTGVAYAHGEPVRVVFFQHEAVEKRSYLGVTTP